MLINQKFKKHLKYASSRFSHWIAKFSVLIGILAVIPLQNYLSCLALICIVLAIFALAFIIPLVGSYILKEFRISTIGKSTVTLKFDDLLEQDCFVITTNLNFDVEPDEKYISSLSLLAKFVKMYYPNDISLLKQEIQKQLSVPKNRQIKPRDYGTTVRIDKESKIIYLMAFTDRNKNDQPEDFYITSIREFFKTIANENHGRVVSVPLFGNNNNLSNSGFMSKSMALESLLTMIHVFEIENQRSELKFQIVVLPEDRAEIIDTVAKYAR